jgi:hypothetical protein
LLWAIVREKGGTIASHIEKAIVLYAKQLETEETQVTNTKDLLYCRWTLEPESELWEAGCGGTFYLNDGAPSENNMSYCCFCGKPLKEIILSESGDDDND